MQFLPYRKQTAAWRPRHFLAIKIGEFSQENSRVKIAWMQFLPAFQGSVLVVEQIAPRRARYFVILTASEFSNGKTHG
ncbi:MAG TPA: hypothetical protein DCZ76_09175 [Treponema sp.]|nr:hypothetical protein [Treponema sp.]